MKIHQLPVKRLKNSDSPLVDVDAQMRDQLSVDPSRSLDQSLGEYGGGIYDD
jgi:hypothetical protein